MPQFASPSSIKRLQKVKSDSFLANTYLKFLLWLGELQIFYSKLVALLSICKKKSSSSGV